MIEEDIQQPLLASVHMHRLYESAYTHIHAPTWAGSNPRPGQAREGQLVLTLDIYGDRGLLSSRDGFVGGSAHNTLSIFHISWGDEEGTDNALTFAVSKQGLGERW